MTEPLSPAAQAVDHAIADRIQLLGEIAPLRQVAAAALRAAADQVVPEEDECMRQAIPDAFDRQQAIRSQLLAIAAELEAQP